LSEKLEFFFYINDRKMNRQS